MSPFASRSIVEHVARGAGAAALVAFALWSISTPTLLRGLGAFGAFAGGVVLLRGCPMCWVIGLFDTISQSRVRSRA